MKYVAKTVTLPSQYAAPDEVCDANLYGVCGLCFLSRYCAVLCGQ